MSEDFSTVMQALIDAGIASPRLETRLLLAEVLQQKPSEINENTVLDGNQQTKVQKLLRRRLQHEPLDKILEHKEFYKFDFRVSKDVLSPRPDTEILVESALEYIPQEKKVKILDLGTGSGCIIISLLLERLNASGDGVDASVAALAVARDNMRQYDLDNRLELIKADWFDDDFMHEIKAPYDFIVTNPPYIKTAEIANLEIEVRQYDPLTALDGGKNGYESVWRFATGRNLTYGRQREYFGINKDKLSDRFIESIPRQTPAASEHNTHSFADVSHGLTEEQVRKEVERCLGCGRAVIDKVKCIGCGVCTAQCRFDAIHLEFEKERTPAKSKKEFFRDVAKFNVGRAGRIVVNETGKLVGLDSVSRARKKQ